MKNKKSIIMFILSVFIASGFVLSGCSSNDGPIGDEGQTEGTRTITIQYFEGGYGSAWIEQAAADYMAVNKEVTVKLIKDPLLQEVISSVLYSNKNVPDIVMTLGFNWQEFVSEGRIEPLDDVFEAEVEKIGGTKVKIKDFITEDYRGYPYTKKIPLPQLEEHPWVMPWNALSVSLAYNEDLLHKTKKSGGGYWTNAPATETELKQLVNDINAMSSADYGGRTVKPFIFPGRSSNFLTFIQMTWWAQYQGLEDNNPSGEGSWYDFWEFESPNVYKQTGLVESYRLLQDLFIDTAAKDYKNIPANVRSMDSVQAQLEFIKGNSVMMPVGTWLENEIMATDDLEEIGPYPDFQNHLRMMTLPSITGARSTNINNAQTSDVMLIPAASTQKHTAKDFLKFLHSEEQLLKYTKTNGVMRPFEYNPLSLAPEHSWTVFQKDAISLYTQNTNFFQFSKNKSPFFVYKNLNPYQPEMRTVLLDLQQSTPAAAANGAFLSVSNNWERWERELGIK